MGKDNQDNQEIMKTFSYIKHINILGLPVDFNNHEILKRINDEEMYLYIFNNRYKYFQKYIQLYYVNICISIILKIIEIRNYNIDYIKINNKVDVYTENDLKTKLHDSHENIINLEIVTDTGICFLYLTENNYNTYDKEKLLEYSKIFCFGTVKNISDNWMKEEDIDMIKTTDIEEDVEMKKIRDKEEEKKKKRRKLKNISFTGLYYLEKIGNNFLENTKVEKVNFLGLNKLQSIGDNFCFKSNNITECNLNTLSNIEIIGNNCLNYCDNLDKVIIRNLENLETIGNHFLSNNNNLIEVQLDGLMNLKIVPNYFISNNKKLKELKLHGLKNIEKIGNNFLCDNINLKELDFVNLNNLETIGESFLCNCWMLSKISNMKKIIIDEKTEDFLKNTPLKNIKSV